MFFLKKCLIYFKVCKGELFKYYVTQMLYHFILFFNGSNVTKLINSGVKSNHYSGVVVVHTEILLNYCKCKTISVKILKVQSIFLKNSICDFRLSVPF